MRRRPTVAHIIAALLLILFGAWALFEGLWQLWSAGIFQRFGIKSGPTEPMLLEIPFLMAHSIAIGIFAVISGVIELASGIALFWQKPWARALAVSWSVLSLVFDFLVLVFRLFYLIPQFHAWMAAQRAGEQAWGNAQGPSLPDRILIIVAVIFLLQSLGNVIVLVLLLLPRAGDEPCRTDDFSDDTLPPAEPD